ncbi:MAG: Ribonuclease HII [Candidatus Methanofastidiosum methylothiophilum]|uniref:Ribonuclease HII n=1 Tax=Candidatus Methanofastidiosum methylothiophilum TaxID=1705564 RepID=A0A150IJZ9_9EURY|nr:MAG: Ribonuclease HII [Candidatus Methanofastidiosum methylthiophilus]KYC47498.1 MAG: Ribonuclease HII [Candidatus Methanofastidiosum methylthiophilus]KYC50398.1 MAG: Ribonuclease HII [Candidatus Methanofastidiosum methylthiophilus]
MHVCGVDEAGRGPVIGPLVVASISIPEEKLNEIESIQVKDSKKLTAKKRKELYSEIINLPGKYYFKILTPTFLNKQMKKYTLNHIELLAFKDAILGLKLPIKKAICDSCDVDSNRFSLNLKDSLGEAFSSCEVIASHKAEDKFPIVAAASILAKVKRDDLIKKIEEEAGISFGSGYPRDPKTINFLKDYYKQNNSFPDFVRTEWKTLDNIKSSISQRKLC